MYKVINFLFATLVLFYFFATYKYYTSTKNFKSKHFTRKNIEQIISEKSLNIPILSNDTADVIVFNNSISNEIKNEKTRSFQNLLKVK